MTLLQLLEMYRDRVIAPRGDKRKKAYQYAIDKISKTAVPRLAGVPLAFGERIVRALRWQVTQHGWTKDGGRFVPMFCKWLKGRQWDDEPVEPTCSDPLAANDAVWADLNLDTRRAS